MFNYKKCATLKQKLNLPPEQSLTVAPPPMPSSKRELARMAINTCFEDFWNKSPSVNVAIVSFRLKEEIPQSEWNQRTQAVLEMIRKAIVQSAGKTEFIWLHRKDTSSRYPEPIFDAVFISGYSNNLSGKTYFAIMRRYLQTGKHTCCESFSMHTPPGYLAPNGMMIRKSHNNLDAGKHWFNKLTDPLKTRFTVESLGCSQMTAPKNKKPFERKPGNTWLSSKHC